MQNKKEIFRCGAKLRQVRERRGYTLKQVAQQADISESLVSQIERNKVSPSVETLLALSDILDVNLEYLFEGYRQEVAVRVTKAKARRKIAEDEVVYEEISKPATSDGVHALEAYIITIPPQGNTHRGSYGHPGREMGYILKGKAELHYESNTYELNEGDSVSFSASTPHVIYNKGDKELKAIWVVSPPQRFC